MPIDLSLLDPKDRQLIVVSSEFRRLRDFVDPASPNWDFFGDDTTARFSAQYAAERARQVAEAKAKRSDEDAARVASGDVSIAMAAKLGGAAALALWGPVGWGILAAVAMGAGSGEDESRSQRRGRDSIASLPAGTLFIHSEDAWPFKFDRGDPADGVAYRRVPGNGTHYTSIAKFDDQLKTHRVLAFKEILAGLGAKRVEIVHDDGRSTNAEGRAKASAWGSSAGVSGSYDSVDANRRRVFAEFPAPSTPPRVSDDHLEWVESDDHLGHLAKMRLQHGTLLDEVEFSTKSSLEIGAELAAKILKIGLSLGGDYKVVEHEAWKLKVEYWPR